MVKLLIIWHEFLRRTVMVNKGDFIFFSNLRQFQLEVLIIVKFKFNVVFALSTKSSARFFVKTGQMSDLIQIQTVYFNRILLIFQVHCI